MFGGKGNDQLDGGDGNDKLSLGPGEPVNGNTIQFAYGETGADLVVGGPTNDFLTGNEDNDVVKGLGGGDELRGGAGEDQLYGGNQADVLQAVDGEHDLANGGKSTDQCNIDPGVDTVKSCETTLKPDKR